jgi:hypothetical protein
MDLTDPKTWTDGMGVVVGAPHIVVPLLIAVAVDVWWVRERFVDKPMVQRLNLAKEHQSYLAEKLNDAHAEIAKLKQQIDSGASPEVLIGTVKSAERFIDQTAMANDDLRKAMTGGITRIKVARDRLARRLDMGD